MMLVRVSMGSAIIYSHSSTHKDSSVQVARYTYSRISRASANGDKAKSGVGWSAEGVAKFLALAYQVKEDRHLLGKEFNKELYKKVVLQSRAATQINLQNNIK
jgi:hypothetical protein